MYDDPTGARNSSGLPDPTHRDAVEAARREARVRLETCVRAMLAVASSMGVRVTARIQLRDRCTGEEWK